VARAGEGYCSASRFCEGATMTIEAGRRGARRLLSEGWRAFGELDRFAAIRETGSKKIKKSARDAASETA
jgi:hypothetical protein